MNNDNQMSNKKIIIAGIATITLLVAGSALGYFIYYKNLDFSLGSSNDIVGEEKEKKVIDYEDLNEEKNEENMSTVEASKSDEDKPVTSSPVPEGLSGPSNYVE